MDEQKIRLLIADDHNLFREGIINLLDTEKDIFIVGEADTGEALLTKYFDLKPDVVLGDISMPVMSGIDALKKLIEMGGEEIEDCVYRFPVGTKLKTVFFMVLKIYQAFG